MSVSDAIKKRNSIRNYKGDSIPEDLLLRVLEAVISSAERRARIR